MYQLWTTADLRALLESLGRAFANPLNEAEHNGERVRYASKYEIRKVADEVVKELRARGELTTDGENVARQKPARMLYTYKTGNP